MSWRKFLKTLGLAVAFIGLAWIPRYTDTEWVADGPLVATWLVVTGWLSLGAIFAGVYIPIRERRLTEIAAVCWISVALVLCARHFIHLSQREIDAQFVPLIEMLWARTGPFPESIPNISDGSVYAGKTYRIEGKIRWPLYYRKTGPESCEIYTYAAFYRKRGFAISYAGGTQPL